MSKKCFHSKTSLSKTWCTVPLFSQCWTIQNVNVFFYCKEILLGSKFKARTINHSCDFQCMCFTCFTNLRKWKYNNNCVVAGRVLFPCGESVPDSGRGDAHQTGAGESRAGEVSAVQRHLQCHEEGKGYQALQSFNDLCVITLNELIWFYISENIRLRLFPRLQTPNLSSVRQFHQFVWLCLHNGIIF